MRCPYCAAPNRDGMRFCIECGESFDGRAPDRLAPPVRESAPARSGLRLPRLPLSFHAREVGLALIILAGVLGWDLVYTGRQAAQDAQAAAYRRGAAALTAHDWVAAATAFQAAGNYQDALARLAGIARTVHEITTRYTDATAEAAAGAWWAATLDYATVAALQPGYQQVATRLPAARTAAGPVLYQLPGDGKTPVLWWSAVDGSDPHPIPGTDDESRIHAVAPTGRWVVYSDYLPTADTHGVRIPRLLDLQTGMVYPILLADGSRPHGLTAEFRTDGSGFWWQEDDRLYYADLTVPPAGPVRLQSCAADIVARDPVSGQTARLLTDRSDRRGGSIGSWLAAGGPCTGDAHLLQHEQVQIEDVAVSPGARFFLYRLTTPGAAPVASTDTLVLFDSLVSRYYPGGDLLPGRHVLANAATQGAGGDAFELRGRFIPGHDPTRPRVLITGPDAPLQVYDLALGTSGPIYTPPASGGWRLLPSSFTVSPSAHWSGIEIWTLTGAQTLSRLVLEPGDASPVWSTLVVADLAYWAGFTADDRYAFYTISRRGPAGEQQMLLYSVPLGAGAPDPAGITPLIQRDIPDPGWMQNIGLSGDGRRLLVLIRPDQVSAVPGDTAHMAGLYALRPDGSDWQAIAPGATSFWVPGAPAWAANDPLP